MNLETSDYMKNFNSVNKISYISKFIAAITAVCLLTCLFAVFVSAEELPSSTPIPTLQPQKTITFDKDINEDITIPAGVNVSIIGNGHALNGTITFAASSQASGSKTTAVIENLVLNGSLLKSSAVVSQNTSELPTVSLDLTLKNCSIQNYNEKALYITNAASLVIDGCCFTNNTVVNSSSSDFAVDINLRSTQNSKLEITNNTFLGCCGRKSAIRIAQQNDSEIINPAKVSGNIFKYALYSNISVEPSKSDLSVGLESKANETANIHSSAFALNINTNKTAVRFWDISASEENIVIIPALKQLVLNEEATSSAAPCETPTAAPNSEPTAAATVTPEPTVEPTLEPSETPTAEPTETPTLEPTETPTAEPDETPDILPSETPMAEPTGTPIIVPCVVPTPDAESTAAPDEKYPLNIEFIGSAAERTGVLVYINNTLADTKNITAYPGDIVSLATYVDDNARVTDITVNGMSIGVGKSFIMPFGGANAVITSRRYVYSPNSGLSTNTFPSATPMPTKIPRPSAAPTTTPIPEPPIPFTDVHTWDWYYSNVCAVYEKGLMNGTSPFLFEPNSETTRAMMVTIMHRMEGAPKITAYTPFYDVPTDTWYSNAVDWAFKNKIVNGMGNGLFAPDESITREQMATMFYRYMTWRGDGPVGSWAILLTYSDTWRISDWASEGVMFCTLTGIMYGNEDGSFAPQNTATRAEIAAVVDRTAQKIGLK